MIIYCCLATNVFDLKIYGDDVDVVTGRHTPTCVKSLNMKKTIFISCGEEHTAILTKVG